MTIKQLEIKNRTYYFYNDLINIKHFDTNLLKLDKKTSVSFVVYYIGYITKVPKWGINSVNPLYLMINRIDGFVEEKDGEKYLKISNIQRNNEALKKYLEVWNGIKDCVEKMHDSKLGEYDKDFMKIRFN